jgi:germacradienol/geosmin synthase
VDRWEAAEIVARLMRERLEQFERLASIGLPKLALDYDLAPSAVAGLELEVELLKDWMSGVLEWHRRTPRYADAELRRVHYGFSQTPTGLGTAAARIMAPAAGACY